MYQFVYELSLEDYEEFSLFYWYHIPQNKNKVIWNQWFFPLLFCICAFVLAFITRDYLFSFLYFVIISLLWVFTYHWRIRRNIRKSISRMAQIGKMPYEGQCMMDFEENDFIAKSQTEEMRSTYEAIEKIALGKNAVYLFNKANAAYILPHRIFANGDERHSFCRFIEAKAPTATVLATDS